MSPTPFRPEPANDASSNPVSQRDEDAQYYRQILHELIEIGTGLARAIHRQAAPDASTTPSAEEASQPAPAPDPTIAVAAAFDRVARAIRRTIALARTIAEAAPPSPAELSAERRLAARKRIIREVEDAIQRRADGHEADALSAELGERLDSPDLDDDIDQLPVPDIIAAICRDLGIAHVLGTHPWKRRTPRDVRDLSARAAGPPTSLLRTTQPGTTQPRTGDPRFPPALRPRARTATGPPSPRSGPPAMTG